ncbi:MAG TPA: 30S ribosomal protein S4 [Candidatus Nanoarchaeia archaeon]|nr:30S ribosomal protein S4 [Candidatus Nanoarchaeia archaeon]
MGDPRKIKRKYSTPLHPWIGSRIEEERKLKKEFGLKNKTEIWKIDSLLRGFKHQAKKLIAREDAQSVIEEKLFKERLFKLGLIEKDAALTDVLGLTVRHLMNRRLQTFIVKKGLARTATQARQFITHRHVKVSSKVIDAPSYLVRRDDEGAIAFAPSSSFNQPDHPERRITEKIQPGSPVGVHGELEPEEEIVLAKKTRKEAPPKEIKVGVQ